MGGDDAHFLLPIHAEEEFVQNHSVEIGAHQGDNHRPAVIAQGAEQGHRQAGDGHGHPQLHAEIFVENLGRNVQPAGGGIAQEQQRQPGADHKAVAQHIQEGVGGEGPEVREQPLQQPQKARHQQGGIYRLHPEFVADEQKAQYQAYGVEPEGEVGYIHRDKPAQHHRQTGDGAHRQMAGDEKEEYRPGDNQGAQGDDEILPNQRIAFHAGSFLSSVSGIPPARAGPGDSPPAPGP